MTATATMPEASTAFLPRDDLDRLSRRLHADGRTVVGPTIRDGAVVYDGIDTIDDLPVGWRVDSAPGSYRLRRDARDRAFDYGVGLTAWKRFTYPPRVPLTTTGDADGLVSSVEPDAPPHGVHRRPGLRARRARHPGPRPARRAGRRRRPRRAARRRPRRGRRVRRRDVDLLLHVDGHRTRGDRRRRHRARRARRRLHGPRRDPGRRAHRRAPAAARGGTAEQVDAAASQVAAVRASIGDPVPTDGLAERLRAAPGPSALGRGRRALPRLHQLHARLPDLLLHERQRQRPTSTAVVGATERTWDSCFTLGFGRVAGDANFRPRVADRYRQWLTHKFSTWWDQFGSTGCVGCGRCIAWCPVGIDVREELLAIAPPGAAAGVTLPWPPRPAGRPCAGARSRRSSRRATSPTEVTRQPARDGRHGDADARDRRPGAARAASPASS